MEVMMAQGEDNKSGKEETMGHLNVELSRERYSGKAGKNDIWLKEAE